MSIYIKAVGNVCPQDTLDNASFLQNVKGYNTSHLKSVEPNYKDFISPAAARRMGKIIKMGVAAANLCLKEAEVTMPDAIITGTGLGCLEDTEQFLNAIIDNKEQFLTPTAFIQSTHNTVGAQIALLLGCKNYNFTYVHRGFSFESALIDSIMMINDKQASDVLVGGVDQFTDAYCYIYNKMGKWKTNVENSLDLLSIPGDGTIAGEGAAFFLVSDKPTQGKDYAEFMDLEMIHKIVPDQLESRMLAFLKNNNINPEDIDCVLLGLNGISSNDAVYDKLSTGIFADNTLGYFKHLCGEYPTASAFAFWLAAQILKNQHIPEVIRLNKAGNGKIKHVLIYNHYEQTNHSFMLFRAC